MYSMHNIEYFSVDCLLTIGVNNLPFLISGCSTKANETNDSADLSVSSMLSILYEKL